jgi:hypothetical protein
MKNINRTFCAALILAGLYLGLGGCLVGVGVRGGGEWGHDGRWMDGGRGGYGHGDIHPPGMRR